MFSRIYRFLDANVEVILASIALVTFSTLVVVQVIMRYALGAPLVWSEEIARYALVWFVWIAGAYAVKFERHVKFNVLVAWIGNKLPIVRRIIRVIVLLLWFAFLVLMLVLSWQQVQQQVASGQVAAGSRIPMSIVYVGLTVGMLLMSFRVGQHIVGAVTDLIKNPHAPHPRDEVEVD